MGEVASEGCSPPLWAGAGSPVAGAVRQARVESTKELKALQKELLQNYLEPGMKALQKKIKCFFWKVCYFLAYGELPPLAPTDRPPHKNFPL